MRPGSWLLVLVLLFFAGVAHAEGRVHVVSRGQTLSGIALRYGTSVSALSRLNGIREKDHIRAGQKLQIPPKSSAKHDRDGDRDGGKAAEVDDDSGMQVLAVPGGGSAYYFTPTGPGRLTLRPVLMYLHGRGGQPERDCRRWARVARRLGWLVCPSGPGALGRGHGWNNDWRVARRVATATVQALRAKYGRRVQLYGNTIMGFSEGAFVAMNVGLREPRTFNRWLLMGADPGYWGAPGKALLSSAKQRMRRVYLITGERDSVVQGTRKVREWLRAASIPTRITTPNDLGHEVALEGKASLYRMALIWLESGGRTGAGEAPERSEKHAKR
jgi:predicted esterase